jgi:hypothetical protein
MDRGIDFLKSQVSNAAMQHRTLLENLEDHEKQAEDVRYRDLCSRAIPQMREHQRMLEEYQREIGAQAGVAKTFVGKALGAARDLADAARESDFLRLVGDIVTARQSQDTFATFREAGKDSRTRSCSGSARSASSTTTSSCAMPIGSFSRCSSSTREAWTLPPICARARRPSRRDRSPRRCALRMGSDSIRSGGAGRRRASSAGRARFDACVVSAPNAGACSIAYAA